MRVSDDSVADKFNSKLKQREEKMREEKRRREIERACRREERGNRVNER